MMNVDEILARLQNGETMDDIAADISKALTAAEQKFQEEKEKEKKIAEAAALEEEAKLNGLAETILLALDEYMSIKYPEVMDGEGLEVAEFRELVDNLLDSIVKMKEVFGDSAFASLQVPKTEYKAPKKAKTADDKIADFLKTMGW